MDPNWNDNQPIYRQLRDRMVALILEGALKEGDPLPSVRAVAADYRLNPLTVLKGYQQLVDERLVEKRRGRGMYVSEGARGCCWPESANDSSTRNGRRFWRSSTGSGSPLRNCSRRHRRSPTRHRRPAAAMPKKNESHHAAAHRSSRSDKKYGKHVALDRANFSVEAGRIVGLIGPNGAGKTSALRAILGLTAYEGQLQVLGREPFANAPRS
jgi:DNA-binding transcriptional regulator YhcF (GntR family)